MAQTAMAYVPKPLEGALSVFRRRNTRTRSENGVVLVFCSLFITTLVGLGGFSVDVGNWYLHVQRLQRAADAAALAGSVYLPNDFTTAHATALDSLNRNAASAHAFEITQSASKPTVLQVRVRETVPNYFLSIFGINQQTFIRSASAEYSPYVPMGSPSNLLGVEYNPLDSWQKSTTVGLQDRYWLNISGPRTSKQTGDRYSSGECTSTTSNCDMTGSYPTLTPADETANLRNHDFSTGEQVFVVRVPHDVEGTLVIQAFDPVFAHVGDDCTAGTLNGGNSPTPVSINPTLYATGGTPQCTGDNLQAGTGSVADRSLNMSFQLWTPELSDGGSVPVTNPNCTAKTYTGQGENLGPRINSDATFRNAFRKWVDLCRMYVDGDTDAGDYELHVKVTNVLANGLNRYALRVGILTSSGTLDVPQTNKLQLFSKGRLVVYARDSSGDVMFYLARINSAAASHTMTVSLFDMGDAVNPSTLRLLPPADAKLGSTPMTAFTGCQYTPPNTPGVFQPMANCSITGITSGTTGPNGYQGKLVHIAIDLPDNYNCNDADPEGCWTRMAVTYNGSTNDTTSWEVSLDGNPVHLVM